MANYTTIHEAARKGDLADVQRHMQNGADVNAKEESPYGFTPLIQAAFHSMEQTSYGHLDVVKYLVANGADVNTKDNEDTTALCWAAAVHGDDKTDVDIVKFLVATGADVNAKNNRGETPLVAAVNKGRLDVVKFLVDAGADVNAKDKDGLTPLMRANNHLDIMKVLVDAGADVNARDNDGGRTSLMLAASHGYLDVVIFLVTKDADVNAKNNEGRTPLMEAVFEGRLDVVEFLKQHGATESQLPTTCSTIHESAEAGNLADVKQLLTRANLDARDKDGKTPMMRAVIAGKLDVVKFLEAKAPGYVVHARDNDGRTSLWWAASKGHLDVVEFLIAHGADVRVGDHENILDRADGRTTIEKGAEDNDGYSPLSMAARGGYLKVVEFLKQHGATE